MLLSEGIGAKLRRFLHVGSIRQALLSAASSARVPDEAPPAG